MDTFLDLGARYFLLEINGTDAALQDAAAHIRARAPEAAPYCDNFYLMAPPLAAPGLWSGSWTLSGPSCKRRGKDMFLSAPQENKKVLVI